MLTLPHHLRVLIRKALRHIHTFLFANYRRWARRHDALNDDDYHAIDERIRGLKNPPTIAVLLPVFDPPLAFLKATIDSVKGQRYPHWQLCICDDASRDAEVVELLQREMATEPRIRLVRRGENGHISRATNDALSLTEAPWVALLDHDDVLRPHALALVAEGIVQFPKAQLIYSDEDKLSATGARRRPYFKPDWNPALLLGQNYLCHLSVYRRERVLALGGMRPGFEGAQDYDLALRFTEGLTASEIVHIPHVLYHWREHAASTASLAQAKPYAVDAARRAVTESLQRRGIAAQVEPVAGMWQSVRPAYLAPAPQVTVVIPTCAGQGNLRRCVETLIARTRYPCFEVLVIDNASPEPHLIEELAGISSPSQCRVHRERDRVSAAALMNIAIIGIDSEYVMLLDENIEVIRADWLDVLVGWCNLDGVGAVGASLWCPDQTLHHGGFVLGIGGVAGCAHRQRLRGELGDHGRGVLAQDFSACSTAGLLVRRQAYVDVGGMDERLQIKDFVDVDLCLKLRQAGWRVVWTPEAELLHHASTAQDTGLHIPDRDRRAAETEVMRQRWSRQLLRDPAYNPNLSLSEEDFRLALDPRVGLRLPWFDE